jgi:branched-chain amino acid transport system permease protein
VIGAELIGVPLGVSADFFTAWPFWIGVGLLAGVYGLLALGLQLNVGFTGIVNFGQVGFMAIGSYSAVILYVDIGLPFIVSLLLSLLITMGVGIAIGLPSLRLRADYFAITTIAFAEVIRISARNARGLTGGNQGTLNLELENERSFTEPWDNVVTWVRDNLLDPIGLSGTDFVDLPLLIFTWLVLALLAFVLARLIRSPWGRVLRAIREDEDAARALGKNAFSYKLQSLAIAAALGSLAGYFLALNLAFLNPNSFEPLFTFIGYAVLVLGGLASYGGVAIGAVLLWVLLEGTRFLELPLPAEKVAALRFMLVGLVLILLMAFRPQGIRGKREEMVLGD